jgi:hypothetical protein
VWTRVLASNELEHIGEARITISVRMPPAGGDMVVSPSVGVGMHTSFTLSAQNWGSDPESMPLSFTFFCRERDSEANRQLLLGEGTEFSVENLLPSAHAADQRLLVGVEVSDIFASSSVASTLVTVESPTKSLGVELMAMLEAALLTRVDSFFRIGDMQNVHAQVALLGETLNAEPPCNTSEASTCLSGDVFSRQLLRTRLLLTLQAANYSVVPSPKSLKEQALAMVAILGREDEINFDTANLANTLLINSRKAILRQLGKAGLEVEALAYLHGTMTLRLLMSLSNPQRLKIRQSASDDVAQEAGAGVWLRRLRLAKRAAEQGRHIPQYFNSEAHEGEEGEAEERDEEVAGAGGGNVQNGRRAEEGGGGSGGRRNNVQEIRKLMYGLMVTAMSSISSLSLAQTLAGSKAVLLVLPGCTVNTSHVTREFLQYLPWVAEGAASNYAAQVLES